MGRLFAQTHQNWTKEDLRNAAWSDEPQFQLQHSDFLGHRITNLTQLCDAVTSTWPKMSEEPV